MYFLFQLLQTLLLLCCSLHFLHHLFDVFRLLWERSCAKLVLHWTRHPSHPQENCNWYIKTKKFKFAKLKIQYFLTVSSGRVLISLVLLSLQCWRRLYETTCVSVFSNGKINIAQYLAGFIHYAAAAAAIVAEAPVFASKGKTGKT